MCHRVFFLFGLVGPVVAGVCELKSPVTCMIFMFFVFWIYVRDGGINTLTGQRRIDKTYELT